MRAPFQGREIVAVKAAQPAIKSLPADAEVPAGARGVPSVEEVEKHPLKPCLCCPAYALSEARQLARLGKLIPSDLAHPDTLPSVTNHSERAQSTANHGLVTRVKRHGVGRAWGQVCTRNGRKTAGVTDQDERDRARPLNAELQIDAFGGRVGIVEAPVAGLIPAGFRGLAQIMAIHGCI